MIVVEYKHHLLSLHGIAPFGSGKCRLGNDKHRCSTVMSNHLLRRGGCATEADESLCLGSKSRHARRLRDMRIR